MGISMFRYVSLCGGFSQLTMKNSGLMFSMVKYVSIYLIIRNDGVGCSNHPCGTNTFNGLGEISALYF
jgi:hypothetical protein